MPKEIKLDATIAPLDSLTHDKAYLDAVKVGGFHGGKLNGLAHYYTPR